MATITNSIGTAPAATGISGTISGTALTVAAVTGTIKVGMTLSGGGATTCKILSGPGGTGSYTVDVSQTSTLSGATAARDYSSLASYGAALPADFTATGAGNSYIGELYNDGLLNSTSSTNFNGHTTDSTHTLILRCAAGHSFRDNANASTNALKFNQANGVAVQGSGSFINAFSSDMDFITVDGIQFKTANTGTRAFAFTASFTQNMKLQNCIIESADDAVQINRGQAFNNVIILTGTGGEGLRAASGNCQIIGNTIVRPSDITAANNGIVCVYGAGPIYNNAIFGFATAGSGWTAGTSTNNATDAASLPAGTGLTSVTYANQFVSTTSASRDFRLKAGSSLIDAGATQGPATDIIGTSRPQGTAYDIGCWELVSSGFSIFRDWLMPVEMGGSLNATATAPADSRGDMAGQATSPAEFGQGEAATLSVPAETGASVRQDTPAPIAAMANVQATAGALAAIMAAISADVKAQAEFSAVARADMPGPIDTQGLARADLPSAIDTQGLLRSDVSAQQESGIGVRRDQAAPIEAGSGIAIIITAPVEFAGSGSSITSDVGISIEWTSGVVRDLPAPTDRGAAVSAVSNVLAALGGSITADTSVPADRLAQTAAALTAAVEAMAGVVKDQPAPVGFTMGLSSGCTVQVEFDGTAIVILVFDPKGVVIGRDRLTAVIGRDRKTTIEGH